MNVPSMFSGLTNPIEPPTLLRPRSDWAIAAGAASVHSASARSRDLRFMISSERWQGDAPSWGTRELSAAVGGISSLASAGLPERLEPDREVADRGRGHRVGRGRWRRRGRPAPFLDRADVDAALPGREGGRAGHRRRVATHEVESRARAVGEHHPAAAAEGRGTDEASVRLLAG